MKKLTRNLRDNSIEAFILALETINRPTINYRAEAFCFLFCNAWELIIKAKLLDDGKNIFYRKKKKQPRRSISLDDCINRIFTSENDPIRLNILKISELRNNATHLVIPFIPIGIMGLFQAGVLNYPNKLKEWFGINLSELVPLGMMVLVYDFDPKKHSLEHAKMTRKLPSETIHWLTNFQNSVGEQSIAIGKNSSQYFIPINYQLAIVKSPKKSDIVLSSGTSGKEAIIIEVPKDPNITHPYRGRTDVVRLVNEKLENNQIFNIFDIQCIKKVYNIDKKAEYCYLPKFSSPQYSDLFINWIIKQANKDSDFFIKTRNKAAKL